MTESRVLATAGRGALAGLPAGRIIDWDSPTTERAIAVLTASLAGIGEDEASRHARVLLGLYASSRAHDPDVYVRGIVTILAEIPADLIRGVIDDVTRRCRYLTRADLADAATEAMRHRRDLLARALERRRDLLARALEPPPPTEAERAELSRRFATLTSALAGHQDARRALGWPDAPEEPPPPAVSSATQDRQRAALAAAAAEWRAEADTDTDRQP